MKSKLSKLTLSIEDWNAISLLSSLLEPFYDATIQLQRQNYPMLSVSKIIEKTLFEFFALKSKITNANERERWLAKICCDNLQKYLIDKISKTQRDVALVIFILKLWIEIKIVINFLLLLIRWRHFLTHKRFIG